MLAAGCAAPQAGAPLAIDVQTSWGDRLDEDDPRAIETVLAAPERYDPAVLYALSGALFRLDRKQEAAFWFYSAQLKARSDANKALDPSVHQAVSALNDRYGLDINRWTFQDRERLRNIVEEVVEADREAPRSYDPRWIASMDVSGTSGDIRFVSDADWPDIDESTRSDYLDNFRRAMDAMDARDAAAAEG